MALPTFNLKQLIEAGLHYGHITQRWNPLMAPYIFGIRSGIHIIDLEQTMVLLQKALEVTHQVAYNGGRILFVGTKTQAVDIIKSAAERCGQYYVNHRWLGGMMTNWKTVSQSINRLKNIEATIENPQLMTKKEILKLKHEQEKMNLVLCGVREMGGVPDLLFVVDTNKERIAIQEANRLKIPIIAVVDSNSNPRNITHPIPGNDDAIRSIDLCANLLADSILDGLHSGLSASGVDIGEAKDVENISVS
ncbi:MAG: 30S ribosomal protein S2 [Holosporales bacterium]|jgi:small subunit ribosomal protein S2|nr:30S ribosomal protein S2 [Holosporales bacterium]